MMTLLFYASAVYELGKAEFMSIDQIKISVIKASSKITKMTTQPRMKKMSAVRTLESGRKVYDGVYNLKA